MIVVGPIFGMHYKKEPPEPTSISAPAQDDEDDTRAVTLPPSESE